MSFKLTRDNKALGGPGGTKRRLRRLVFVLLLALFSFFLGILVRNRREKREKSIEVYIGKGKARCLRLDYAWKLKTLPFTDQKAGIISIFFMYDCNASPEQYSS